MFAAAAAVVGLTVTEIIAFDDVVVVVSGTPLVCVSVVVFIITVGCDVDEVTVTETEELPSGVTDAVIFGNVDDDDDDGGGGGGGGGRGDKASQPSIASFFALRFCLVFLSSPSSVLWSSDLGSFPEGPDGDDVDDVFLRLLLLLPLLPLPDFFFSDPSASSFFRLLLFFSFSFSFSASLGVDVEAEPPAVVAAVVFVVVVVTVLLLLLLLLCVWELLLWRRLVPMT